VSTTNDREDKQLEATFALHQEQVQEEEPQPHQIRELPVTLDSVLIRIADNDKVSPLSSKLMKKVVADMLRRLDDYKVLIEQRNKIIDALQTNFGILKAMSFNVEA